MGAQERRRWGLAESGGQVPLQMFSCVILGHSLTFSELQFPQLLGKGVIQSALQLSFILVIASDCVP